MESRSGKDFAIVAKLDIGGSWASGDPSVVQLLYKGGGGGGGGGFISIYLNQNFYLQMESSSGKDFAIVAKLDIGGSWASGDPSVVQLLYKGGRGGGGGGGWGNIHLHSTPITPLPEPPLSCATSSRAQVPCRRARVALALSRPLPWPPFRRSSPLPEPPSDPIAAPSPSSCSEPPFQCRALVPRHPRVVTISCSSA